MERKVNLVGKCVERLTFGAFEEDNISIIDLCCGGNYQVKF